MCVVFEGKCRDYNSSSKIGSCLEAVRKLPSLIKYLIYLQSKKRVNKKLCKLSASLAIFLCAITYAAYGLCNKL